MDPFLLVAEWWWLVPTAAAGVTAGAIGVRRRNTRSGRRLEYDAARHGTSARPSSARWCDGRP
ncbi:hypothetical protein AB1285_21505 [Microbacterium sp. NRRL B-14842]|uniref:hypothetical protein n=1 Tax=Microbacterium sp. NRRL B-14842 TaxID=3162881 RepID=UPI003D28B308